MILILSSEEKENRLGFDRSKINKAEVYRDIIYKNIEYDYYRGGSIMEKLKVFENSNFGKIRVLEIDGEPWFIAVDIAKVLDYRTAYDMTRI